MKGILSLYLFLKFLTIKEIDKQYLHIYFDFEIALLREIIVSYSLSTAQKSLSDLFLMR